MLRAEVAVNRRFRHLVGVRPRGYHRAVLIVFHMHRLGFVPQLPKLRVRPRARQADDLCACAFRILCPSRRFRVVGVLDSLHGDGRNARSILCQRHVRVVPLFRDVEAVQSADFARFVRNRNRLMRPRRLSVHITVRRIIADAERNSAAAKLCFFHFIAVVRLHGPAAFVEPSHRVLRIFAQPNALVRKVGNRQRLGDGGESAVQRPCAILQDFARQAEGQRVRVGNVDVIRHVPVLHHVDAQVLHFHVFQRQRTANRRVHLIFCLRVADVVVVKVLPRVLRHTADLHQAVKAAGRVQLHQTVCVGVRAHHRAVQLLHRVRFQCVGLEAPLVRFRQRRGVNALRVCLRPRIRLGVVGPARLVQRHLHAREALGNRVLRAVRRVPFLRYVEVDFAVEVFGAVGVQQFRRHRAGRLGGSRVDGVSDAGRGVVRHLALDDVVDVVELVAVRVRAGGFQLRPLGVPAVRRRQCSLAAAVGVVRVLTDERPLLRAEHFVSRCRLFSQHRIVLFLRQRIAAKHHEDADRARILIGFVANPVLLHLHVVAILAVLHLNVDVRRAVDGVRTIHHALDAGSSHERLQLILRNRTEIAVIIAVRVASRMVSGIVRSRNDVEDDQRAILQHKVVRLDGLRFRQHVRNVRLERTLIQVLRTVTVRNRTVLIRVDLTIFAANRLELFGIRVPCVEREFRSRQQQRGIRAVHLADDEVVVDVAAALTEVVVVAVVQVGARGAVAAKACCVAQFRTDALAAHVVEVVLVRHLGRQENVFLRRVFQNQRLAVRNGDSYVQETFTGNRSLYLLTVTVGSVPVDVFRFRELHLPEILLYLCAAQQMTIAAFINFQNRIAVFILQRLIEPEGTFIQRHIAQIRILASPSKNSIGQFIRQRERAGAWIQLRAGLVDVDGVSDSRLLVAALDTGALLDVDRLDRLFLVGQLGLLLLVIERRVVFHIQLVVQHAQHQSAVHRVCQEVVGNLAVNLDGHIRLAVEDRFRTAGILIRLHGDVDSLLLLCAFAHRRQISLDGNALLAPLAADLIAIRNRTGIVQLLLGNGHLRAVRFAKNQP